MIKSMTGFGRAEYADADRKIIIEMKSVNHRFSEFSIKMPKRLARYEIELKNLLKENIERGKVDVFITYENLKSSDVAVRYNKDIAEEYLRGIAELRSDMEDFASNSFYEDISIDTDEAIRPAALARFPEVFTLEENVNDDEDETLQALKKVMKEAICAFTAARETEGENLKADMMDKLLRMDELVSELESMQPELTEAYRSRLREKIASLLGDANIDESRIAMEVTLYADKIAVDEEITRLKSHISSSIDILKKGGSAGRKMDFIIQEMNREANTTLSKSDSIRVTDIGIELKTLIEKLREQVQNIE